MGYLKYIPDTLIDGFIKTICCPCACNIIIPNSDERNYVNVFTNLLDTTLHITDFECINMDKNIDYSKQWRRFVILNLDKINRGLSDEYINDLHSHLEQDDIYGPVV